MDPDDELTPEDPLTELSRLASEAIDSQSKGATSAERRRRCDRVLELEAQGFITDDRACFLAGLVMICGESVADFHHAHRFARRATELGDERAWTLRAMAWDRLLIELGRPQHFGTQIIRMGGRWSLGEVNPQVTDWERALFGVPPLYVQLQRVEELQRSEQE
ncbi:hypothetical protein [uncultured Chloroflexus sp.]|uniref:hypothetical protein n=1 Tax=uncultured Chloroflexus sp. TaxID=214040 RepID=UPI002630B14F|nr:hypothetical protein [uncultured Chloroflexus sp.]